MNWWPGTACARVRARASAFLDGRLTAAQRAAVQQHLHACRTCMGELQQVARLARAMHNLPPFRLADGMASRLRRQLATAPAASASPPPRRTLAQRAVWGAALVAAAVALFAFGYRCGHRDGGGSAPLAPQTTAPAAVTTEDPVRPRRRSVPPPPPPVIEPAPRANARFATFGEPLPAVDASEPGAPGAADAPRAPAGDGVRRPPRR